MWLISLGDSSDLWGFHSFDFYPLIQSPLILQGDIRVGEPSQTGIRTFTN